MTARAYPPKSIQSALDRPICRASCKREKCLSWTRSARWTPPVEMEWTGLLFLVTVCLLVNMPACSSAHVPEHQTSMYLLLRRRNEFTSTHPILMALRPASNPEVVQQPLRLRGGAFWLSAVAGPEEYRAFWRTLSTAPAHWIRDRMQKLCPFGAKEANIAAKELAVLMEDSPSGGRLRGGGLAHSGPKPEVASQPSEEDHLQLDTRVPFAQAGDVAVVTGASGFMAGHIIRELTAQGLKVRGTVRNLTDAGKTQHLKELFPELELYEADLLDDGSFLECCKGARFVFHVASPFQYVAEDPERDIVEPAVKGTMNVLRCARLAGGVRRVVLTSSTASVITLNPPSDPSWQWSEDDWNTDTTLEDNPYRYSKTLAEQAAWLWMASCYNRQSSVCACFTSHNYAILTIPLSHLNLCTTSTSVLTKPLQQPQLRHRWRLRRRSAGAVGARGRRSAIHRLLRPRGNQPHRL